MSHTMLCNNGNDVLILLCPLLLSNITLSSVSTTNDIVMSVKSLLIPVMSCPWLANHTTRGSRMSAMSGMFIQTGILAMLATLVMSLILNDNPYALGWIPIGLVRRRYKYLADFYGPDDLTQLAGTGTDIFRRTDTVVVPTGKTA
uniref:Uncharacterized protein n=1 Tax=Glossina austeni TaxID=7395 RepID=A0A1A9VPX9_GLOAU